MAQEREAALHTYSRGKAKMSFFSTANPQEFVVIETNEDRETAKVNLLFEDNRCIITMELKPKYEMSPQYEIETEGFGTLLVFCTWCAREQGAETISVTYPDRINDIVQSAFEQAQDTNNFSNPAILSCEYLITLLGERCAFSAEGVDE